MSVKKVCTTLLVAALFLGVLPPLPASAAPDSSVRTHTFDTPIDAISFRLSGGAQSIDMQYLNDGTWSDWTAVEIDADVDPVETQMFMLPVGVTAVRTRGNTDYISHPIRVSSDPVKYNVASALMAQATTKKILSRTDWGADASLLYEGTKTGSSSSQGDVSADQAKGDNSATTAREKECIAAQRDYPEQFKTSSTVTKDSNGTYRWPLQYSKEVHLFVVHHTALLVSGDTRPAVERMRALYQYHANSRGWGDIGYNFIIDEKGQMYEGRNGGLYTVGGHAYCNNVGTIGISLMGNFELEQPSQEQVKSLQWLLKDLAQTYKVDLSQPIEHHGKRFLMPVVGHRDVVPTTCPGYYMNGVMGQVVANVRSGNVSNGVVFTGLKTPPATISQPATIVPTTPGAPTMNNGLNTQGRTTIATNPGGQQRIMLTYTAGIAGGRAGTRLADVRKSAGGVKIWQIDGDARLDVSSALFLQYDVPGGETQEISLLVQMPVSEGTQWIDIGSTRFTFQIAGRRVRTGTYVNPFSGNPAMIVAPAAKPRPVLRATNKLRSNPLAASSSSTAAYQPSTTPSTTTSVSAPVYSSDPNAIRIRLSVDAAAPTVTFTSRGTVTGPVSAGNTLCCPSFF
jgi:N-acetylmuramoyl-L-alanine amidase